MTMPPPLPEDIFASLPAAAQLYIRQLEAFAAQLSAQVTALTARLAQLEARVGQNSSNSSRPPSSDGPQVKRGVPRPPSGRRRGGQKGHPKHNRVILPPDEVVERLPIAMPSDQEGGHKACHRDPEPGLFRPLLPAGLVDVGIEPSGVLQGQRTLTR
jgi:transposase